MPNNNYPRFSTLREQAQKWVDEQVAYCENSIKEAEEKIKEAEETISLLKLDVKTSTEYRDNYLNGIDGKAADFVASGMSLFLYRHKLSKKELSNLITDCDNNLRKHLVKNIKDSPEKSALLAAYDKDPDFAHQMFVMGYDNESHFLRNMENEMSFAPTEPLLIEEPSLPNDTNSPTVSITDYFREYTPENITFLKPNEIFVFGSNIYGRHGDGAAHDACQLFGAKWGVGEGLTGQCYALPTMEGGIDYIRGKVNVFLEFAHANPELKFYVTKIACGIAGFSVNDIGPLFRDAFVLPNVILPSEFVKAIKDMFAQNATSTTVESPAAPKNNNKQQTEKSYTRSDSKAFADKVRKNIKGWYKSDTDNEKAIKRIVRQREEIISLLKSVSFFDTNPLLQYLDSTGFFYRPSSRDRHHNFPGGLAEHSLGTYILVKEWNDLPEEERRRHIIYTKMLNKHNDIRCDIFNEKMDAEKMIVASICHDLCKAKHYYFVGRSIRSDQSDNEFKSMHGSLSVRRLEKCGLLKDSFPEIMQAIDLHMKLFSQPHNDKYAKKQIEGRKSLLTVILWAADKVDASRHPVGKV